MAWTYRSRRYSSRTVRRSFRRRRMARPRYRPRYRRSRRSRKTASPVVKLTSEITWDNFAQQSGQARRYSPFYFAPTLLPGFPDYQLTYSQFRILKCKLQLARKRRRRSRQLPSRSQSSFARNMGPSNLGDNRSEVFRPRRRRDGSTSDQMAEGHLSQQDNQETIDRLQAVHPGGHPGAVQYAERPMVPYLGVQSLDALQLG